ncbi:MAG: aminotransferase class V-fold PLP-dependent enzyme [Saprospiraceae bacterium]
MNPVKIKTHFPIFTNHPDLVYFDNAATTQKPASVIKAISDFYESQNANISRGVYPISAKATAAYEEVRQKAADFFGAANSNCIAFTKGTTDGINIVANGFLKNKIQEGDNIVISAMEHHANLIPWQQLAKSVGADLRIIPVNVDGELLLEKLPELLDERTQLLAITAISNSIGTINPLSEIIAFAKKHSIQVLVDGAQSAGLYPLNLQELDCDFYVCSAHKMFGPTGVGMLYVHPRKHTVMKPVVFGGGAIRKVTFEETEFLNYPHVLEAGTPNIAGVIGLGAAIDFCENIDKIEAVQHIKNLGAYLRESIACLANGSGQVEIEGVRVIGEAKNRTGIVSFVMENVHPHDVAQFLGAEGIAVRAGHHCTQPLLDHLGVEATIRVSFSIYNSKEEVDKFVAILKGIKSFWES